MIEIKGLYKDFGALHVLRGVSLNVEQGDIISIIGPSGSGKSTLLNMIGGARLMSRRVVPGLGYVGKIQ